MPTLVTGKRATDLVSSSLIKRDVFEAIYMFDPYQTPIEQYFLANKQSRLRTGNPKFEMQEDVLVPHTGSFTDALAGGGTTEADIVVDDDQKMIVGSLIKNTANNEVYRVTAVDAANGEIDIKKVGSGNITATSASTNFIIIGTAFAEGGDAAGAVSTQGTFPYNYTEIFKKAVHMSGTQMATENYGGSDWVNQRMKITKEFKLDLERSWVYGLRHLDSATAGGYIRQSGGFLDSSGSGISDASQYIGNVAPSEDWFFKTYCKTLFAKGTNEKALYLGADLLLAINDYQKVKQQPRKAEAEYGVDVQVILTPFGRLKLIWHPLLEDVYSKWGIAVDRASDFFKYRFLSANGVNRDMQYQQNLAATGYDQKKDQYLAEVGLHLAGAGQGVHRVIYPGASA